MSSMLTILILLAIAAVAAFGFRMAMPKRQRPPKGVTERVQRATQDMQNRVTRQSSHLDQADTLPEGVPLAQILANRPVPVPLPQGLNRRAERLQARHRETGAPENMRALAKLLIDTADAGLPDAYAFHDGARVFLACADTQVLGEFAVEAEARLPELASWLDLDLSIAALAVARERAPGVLDRLVARTEAMRQQIWAARVDELLASIAHCASQGRHASGDALVLATYVAKRPDLAPRAVSEMAMQPNDPIWLTAWLMLETRVLAAGHGVNIPAFRSRLMSALSRRDPLLVAAAADAAQVLLDHEAFQDINALWERVAHAMNRVQPPPKALHDLAQRLGIAPPDEAT